MASTTPKASFRSISEEDTDNMVAAAADVVVANPVNEKYNQICECLDRPSRKISLWKLRELALTPGGLVNAELRQRVWPTLIGLKEDDPWVQSAAQLFEPSADICSEAEDRERDLIRRDVGRSVLFHHSCPSPNSVMGGMSSAVPDDETIKSSAELSIATLTSVLYATISAPLSPTSQEKPHYFQGMHDIGGVLLHNCDYKEVITTALLRQLCQTHMADSAKETFADLQWFLNSVLLAAVHELDPPVYETLFLSGVPLLSSVLPWLLTWFTHSVHDPEGASRLVDAFMASHPLLPFYLSISLLVHPTLRMDILTAELDDPSSMHFAIQNLPSRIRSDWSSSPHGEEYGMYVTAQEMIETALSIMKTMPPQALLQLVDEPDRALSMGLLQNISVTTPTDESEMACTRATIASGNHYLIATSSQSPCEWHKHFGPPVPVVRPPPVVTHKTPLPRWKRIRNRVRRVVRFVRKNKGLSFIGFYFCCIILYAIYDYIHFTQVYYTALLETIPH